MWSDEAIAALRLEPEEWLAAVAQRDLADLDEDELHQLPGMHDEMPEQPVLAAA